jgi:hypothetical protein
MITATATMAAAERLTGGRDVISVEAEGDLSCNVYSLLEGGSFVMVS